MFIGGLDVGTTGCKLTVYDDKGNFIYNSYKEYDVIRKNGEHEIDAEKISLRTQDKMIYDLMEYLKEWLNKVNLKYLSSLHYVEHLKGHFYFA